MVQDAAAGGHAAARDDDPRPGRVVEPLGVLDALAEGEPARREGTFPVGLHPLEVAVVLLGMGGIDGRRLDGHGTVEVDGQ